jgi:hypothetical protein
MCRKPTGICTGRLDPSVVRQVREQRPVVRHRKTERGGVPDLSELTLEEQVVELDKRVRGGVGPMSGQWPVTDDRCGDATGEVQIHP